MAKIFGFQKELPISLSKWRPKSVVAAVRDGQLKPKAPKQTKKLNK